MSLHREIESILPELIRWRHYLHEHPETAFQEIKTSKFIAEKLRSFGMNVEVGIAETGVVGTLQRGSNTDRKVGLRADMDGLDLVEENEFAYKSKHEGKMHACGHDGHTTMLLGAASLLSKSDSFSGTVQFIFQPAEENEGGAKRMIEEGLFDRFPVDSIFGMHNCPLLPLGHFGTREGPMMAAFDVFEILITGRGGHAARPHSSKDPVLASAHTITQLQSIVSRNIDPMEASVISVTEIHGGTTFNVIPNEVRLRGTTRHFSHQVQDLIEARMNEILRGISVAYGVQTELKYHRRYPAVVNSINETRQAILAAKMVADDSHVDINLPPHMGSEDFSFMLKEKPGNYIKLGTGTTQSGGMLHQTRYDFNDAVLSTGVAYWYSLVNSLLPRGSIKDD